MAPVPTLKMCIKAEGGEDDMQKHNAEILQKNKNKKKYLPGIADVSSGCQLIKGSVHTNHNQGYVTMLIHVVVTSIEQPCGNIEEFATSQMEQR